MSTLKRRIPIAGLMGVGLPRLMVLYLLARGVLGSVALVIGAGSLYGIMEGWASTDASGGWGNAELMKQFGMLQAVPALVASVIGISAWSPFGESERTSASPLPRLRLMHITVLLVAGGLVSWVLIAGWPSRAVDIDLDLVAVRNLLGMTGAALLVGRILDARFSWVMPLGFAVVAVVQALSGEPEQIWTSAVWIWNGQSSSATTSWVIAIALFAIGFGWFLRDGSRDAAGEEE